MITESNIGCEETPVSLLKKLLVLWNNACRKSLPVCFLSIIIVIGIFAYICIEISSIENPYMGLSARESVEESILETCSRLGFTDVSVEAGLVPRAKVENLPQYTFTVHATKPDEMTDMKDVFKALNSMEFGAMLACGKNCLFEGTLVCDGDSYSTPACSPYLNGEKANVYLYSSGSRSTQTASIGRRYSSGGLRNYYDAEDFYEDHYDDYDSFDDAEMCWDEYN